MTNRSEVVLEEIRSWIGTPYHHQAAVKGAGCDCLGLIRGVYKVLMGKDAETPPPYTSDWAEMKEEETLLSAANRHLHPVIPREDVEPGDVLIFRMRKNSIAKHAGFVTVVEAGAPTKMIHSQEGVGVVEINLSDWWIRKIVGIYRLPIGD